MKKSFLSRGNVIRINAAGRRLYNTAIAIIKFFQLETKTALIKISEMIAVFNNQFRIEIGSKFFVFQFYWAPDFFYREVASFFLMIRSNNSICAMISIRINDAVFISSHYSFIRKVPQKTTR